jgi:hypothetical protein
MFPRITRSNKNGHQYEYLVISESVKALLLRMLPI